MKNPRRILFVIPTLRTGGAEKYVLEIASKLAATGHHTHVVSLGPIDDGFVNSVNLEYVTITQLRTRKVLSIRSIWVIYQLFKYIKEKNFDIVHLNLLGADILGGIAAILAGCPFLSTQHNTRSWRYSRKVRKQAAKFLHRGVMYFAHAIIAPTLSVRNYLSETTRIPVDKIKVIYHGIDLKKFSPRLRKIGTYLRIGSVGRFERRKGQIYIIESLPRVLSELKNAKIEVWFAGEGIYEHEVRKRAIELGVIKHVRFLGTLKDIPAYLAKIHILAHAATEGEAFCYAALEGLATGKAVIITNTDGIPEFIKDHYNGILVPIHSSEALADAIIEVTKNPKIYSAISGNAVKSVRPFFSKERAINETFQLYTHILNKRKTNH
ncbi:hypothetical protein AMJ83_10130 [candidate division WOR_3 bacterium SM23_42]|uniref:Glycosyltransferase subfamily 4-like N-terminal domain-containing protein n=1 Tax=candidate division WOR_3 bacterium SM23_42 TaxID=1703779 RepID=A0A0S8FQ81_UNCW3|nr:MAG: hypothetical protein AMJ83_10130 [candidate division WOR_3 bacterium SM23_42]